MLARVLHQAPSIMALAIVVAVALNEVAAVRPSPSSARRLVETVFRDTRDPVIIRNSALLAPVLDLIPAPDQERAAVTFKELYKAQRANKSEDIPLDRFHTFLDDVTRGVAAQPDAATDVVQVIRMCWPGVSALPYVIDVTPRFSGNAYPWLEFIVFVLRSGLSTETVEASVLSLIDHLSTLVERPAAFTLQLQAVQSLILVDVPQVGVQAAKQLASIIKSVHEPQAQHVAQAIRSLLVNHDTVAIWQVAAASISDLRELVQHPAAFMLHLLAVQSLLQGIPQPKLNLQALEMLAPIMKLVTVPEAEHIVRLINGLLSNLRAPENDIAVGIWNVAVGLIIDLKFVTSVSGVRLYCGLIVRLVELARQRPPSGGQAIHLELLPNFYSDEPDSKGAIDVVFDLVRSPLHIWRQAGDRTGPTIISVYDAIAADLDYYWTSDPILHMSRRMQEHIDWYNRNLGTEFDTELAVLVARDLRPHPVDLFITADDVACDPRFWYRATRSQWTVYTGPENALQRGLESLYVTWMQFAYARIKRVFVDCLQPVQNRNWQQGLHDRMPMIKAVTLHLHPVPPVMSCTTALHRVWDQFERPTLDTVKSVVGIAKSVVGHADLKPVTDLVQSLALRSAQNPDANVSLYAVLKPVVEASVEMAESVTDLDTWCTMLHTILSHKRHFPAQPAAHIRDLYQALLTAIRNPFTVYRAPDGYSVRTPQARNLYDIVTEFLQQEPPSMELAEISVEFSEYVTEHCNQAAQIDLTLELECRAESGRVFPGPYSNVYFVATREAGPTSFLSMFATWLKIIELASRHAAKYHCSFRRPKHDWVKVVLSRYRQDLDLIATGYTNAAVQKAEPVHDKNLDDDEGTGHSEISDDELLDEDDWDLDYEYEEYLNSLEE